MYSFQPCSTRDRKCLIETDELSIYECVKCNRLNKLREMFIIAEPTCTSISAFPKFQAKKLKSHIRDYNSGNHCSIQYIKDIVRI